MKSAGHNQPAHRRLKWNQNGGRLPKEAPHKIGSQINWNSNQSISQCNNRHSCLHNCTSARSSLRYDTPLLENRSSGKLFQFPKPSYFQWQMKCSEEPIFVYHFYIFNILVALRKNFDCHPLTYGGGCNDIHGARSVFWSQPCGAPSSIPALGLSNIPQGSTSQNK